jgi:polysaccharide pyruvyl transferase WcaK-like protein
MRYGCYDAIRDQLKMVVGVGGAYLRTGPVSYTVKLAVAHLAQLVWAAECGLPTVFMPQSIGPLHGVSGQLVQRLLRKINCIAVRDDLTVSELAGATNLKRVPDLAILRLMRDLPTLNLAHKPHKIFISARPLHGKLATLAAMPRLKRLRELLPEAEIITQSRGRNNNDEKFYEALGWPTRCRTTAEVVAQGESGVIVSVRLHGALQAMLGGMPAIHLSYERKGFGAYADLNLQPWLHSAVDFSPERVAAQVRDLQQDASGYWQQAAANRATIMAREAEMVETICRLYRA